ncbi:MAG TPA: HDOD domain-containing protein [Geobacteraceae bacterium]
MTENCSIVDLINAYLQDDATNIPVFHAVALRLQQVLGQDDFNIDEVNRLITADPGLASQVLRVSNSSFYSGLNKITTIRDAIVRLGASSVANIAMLATQQDMYRSADAKLNGIMGALWKHAYCCAIGARWLAGRINLNALAEEAFLAALLHDIGKLHLLKIMEEIIKGGKAGMAVSPALLVEVINSRHVEQGHRLMEKWSMPEAYCAVVHDHHAAQWDKGNLLLALVRLANHACNKAGAGMHAEPELLLFASDEAQVLGIREITLAELEIVIEDAITKTLPRAH